MFLGGFVATGLLLAGLVSGIDESLTSLCQHGVGDVRGWSQRCFDARGFRVGGHLKEVDCHTVMLELQTLLSLSLFLFQLV